MLVLGSSSDDRSNILLPMMSKAFQDGSGGVFVNANADPDVLSRITDMAAKAGRSHLLHVLDLRSDDLSGPPHTTTFNPFETASYYRAVDIILDVVTTPDDDYSDRNGILLMIEPIIEALCHLRDNNGVTLDCAKIMEYTNRDRLGELGCHKGLPDRIKDRISNYLCNVPVSSFERAQMLVHLGIGSVMDKCPVFRADGGGTPTTSNIDIAGIRARREYLLVLLPALEKCCDRVAACGRLVSASIRATLSDLLHGTSTNLEAMETLKPGGKGHIPFVCIFDDGSYYLPSGMQIMMAMARALGICVVVGEADLTSVYRMDGNPRSRWSGNVNGGFCTKVVMRLESWHEKVGDLLASASLGRTHVPRSLQGHNGNPFASTRLFIKGMQSNQFIIVSDGRMTFGRVD